MEELYNRLETIRISEQNAFINADIRVVQSMKLDGLMHEKMTAISPRNIVITNVESPHPRDLVSNDDSRTSPLKL